MVEAYDLYLSSNLRELDMPAEEALKLATALVGQGDTWKTRRRRRITLVACGSNILGF